MAVFDASPWKNFLSKQFLYATSKVIKTEEDNWYRLPLSIRQVKHRIINHHCVKSVCIRSYSGPYFPAFGLNTEKYGVSLRIQCECEKIRTKIHGQIKLIKLNCYIFWNKSCSINFDVYSINLVWSDSFQTKYKLALSQ